MVRATIDCPSISECTRVWLPTVTISVTVPLSSQQLALAGLEASRTCRCSGRSTATPWGRRSLAPLEIGVCAMPRRISPLSLA
ncbi:hypothetical protein D3C85_1607170 [compost metagenome]